MKHLLLSIIILLSFSGCEDKKNDAAQQAAHDAQIAAQAKAELLAEINAKEKAHSKKDVKLNQMGISMDKDTITINTSKTKDYLQQLSHKMEIQMKQISDDLQKGIIETKEAGIHISNDNINIDLNKTRNLLEEWGQKIQVFVKEFDEVAQTLESNTSKGH